MVAKADVAVGGLWTLACGLARRQGDYKAMLARADERRLNDFDGRGALSAQGLAEFCEFTLKIAIDQLAFMEELLALDGLQRRISAFGSRLESERTLLKGSAAVMVEAMLRGEIPRGSVATISGVSARTGQTITRELLERGLVTSNTPKGLLRFAVPGFAAANFFPNLFPAGAE